jgi:serine/threonine protein phosphatase PrpC
LFTLKGKRVEAENPGANFTKDGYVSITDLVNRCQHQLAMTRALGHTMLSKCGISSKPQIRSVKITKKDLFVVIASDGK